MFKSYWTLDAVFIKRAISLCGFLSMQGIYYSLRTFLDKPEYCNAIDISPGISGKTFIVQVNKGIPREVMHLYN